MAHLYIYNLYSHNPKYNGIKIQEDRMKQFHVLSPFLFSLYLWSECQILKNIHVMYIYEMSVAI